MKKIFDSTNTLRDFVAWGWTAAELSTRNVTINGANVTAANVGWSGAPITAPGAGTPSVLQRTGERHERRGELRHQPGRELNTTNTGLTLQWNSSTPITVAPTSAPLATDEWLGYFTLATAGAGVRLTATAATSHIGISGSFDINAALADTDNDGIPDAYETAIGLAVGTNDATLDLDGDGASNRAESLAGTAANAPASRLAIGSAVVPGAGQFQVMWPAVAGKLYRVVISEDLTTWNALTTRLPTMTGSQTVIFATAGARRFSCAWKSSQSRSPLQPPMKYALLSAALLAPAFSASAPAAEPSVLELVAGHYAQLAALSLDADAASPAAPQAKPAGLQPATLATSALQPAAGLHSSGRGLMSTDDWRRLFPAKGSR